MTVTAAQISALLKGSGELTLLAELSFGFQLSQLRVLSVKANNTAVPATMPDNVNNSIVGDLTAEWYGTLGSFAGGGGGAQALFTKNVGGAISYRLILLNGGTLRFDWSDDGTANAGHFFNAMATATLGSVGLTIGQYFGLRIRHDVDNGAAGNDVFFDFTLNDGLTWAQIGATVTNTGGSAVTSHFDSASPLNIGDTSTFPFTGVTSIYRMKLSAGLPGALVLEQDFNPNTALEGALTVADAILGTWTIGTASQASIAVGVPTPATGKVYFADRPYSTGPADVPPNTIYRDVIDSAPEIERSIDLQTLGGRGSTTVGGLTLNNADGSLDYLLDLIVDGYDIALYLGDRSWLRTDFQLAGVASVTNIRSANDKQIVVNLGSKNKLLDATIVGDPIASGPNAGKAKPVLLGAVSNFDMTPYLVDSANFIYQFNNRAVNAILPASPFPDYQVQEIWQVRDDGVSLQPTTTLTGSWTADATTDTLTKVGHGLSADMVVMTLSTGTFPAGMTPNKQYWVLSSGLTADNFKLSLTRGGTPIDITANFGPTAQVAPMRRFYVDAVNAQITLSSAPAGRVTMDFFGHLPDVSQGGPQYGFTLNKPFDGFRYLLNTYTKLTASERDDTTFDALGNTIAAAYPNLSWGAPVLSRTNVLDVLDGIALLTNAWYSWNCQGKLIVGKLDLQNLDSVAAIDTVTEADVEGDPSCENLVIQFGRMIVNGGANATVQTDMSSAVTAANRSVWSQPYWVQTKSTDTNLGTYSADWWAYHKTAIDSQPVNLPNAMFNFGLAPDVATIQAICDERTALFHPFTRKLACTVGLDKYALNPGDCVLVTYPRYGLAAGKKFRVAAVKTRPSDRVVDLVLVRQSIPDYVSSSHA